MPRLTSLFLSFLLLVLISMLVRAQEGIFLDGFENNDPVIASSPVTSGLLGEPYSYDVDAEDVDGDALLYLLTTSPAGMTIDPVSGLIQWTPGSGGVFDVAVDVSDGQGGSTQQAWMITVSEGMDTDSDGLSDFLEEAIGTDPNDPDSDDDGLLDGEEFYTLGSDPLEPDSDSDGIDDGDEVLVVGTDPTDNDTDDDYFGDGLELTYGTDPLDGADFPLGPPDPETLAPPNNPTATTTLNDSVAFLYTAAPQIQTGVDPKDIDPRRVAVLRGRLLTREGLPLPGVTIRVLGHPEFGQTLSRVDGHYDLAVNGGQRLTLDFVRDGYLPAQRAVDVPWQQYVDVVVTALVPLDTQVTQVDLMSGSMLMASASTVSDADGQRQSAVVFPPGTTAELQLEGGGTMPVTSLDIRATEYTVGDGGEMAMPGQLPPASGYTYAAELSADEALEPGVTGLQFNQPVYSYLENYLGFPVGTVVPNGFYDRTLAAWVPAENGLVIKIVGVSGSLADIDIDGDDVADGSPALTALGFTDDERASLASAYPVGQSLWRVPVEHFTPWDHNWPYGPPDDAEPPSVPAPSPPSPDIEMCIAEAPGSIIEAQNQVLREEIPVAGTPYMLTYRSTDAPGRTTDRVVDISLTRDSVPASLMRVELSLNVAGQQHFQSFAPTPGQQIRFTWNGKDAYDRNVYGRQKLTGGIAHIYEAVYYEPDDFERAFSRFGGAPLQANQARAEVSIVQPFHNLLGSFDARNQGLGGWRLDVHHAYDPVGRVLVTGCGNSRGSAVINPGSIVTVAGISSGGYNGDNIPATQARLDSPEDVFALADGGFLIADTSNHRIRKVDANGIITTIAGNGDAVYSGDGGPALDATLRRPRSIAVGPDGSIYFTEELRVRRITPDGIIDTIAGNGSGGSSGDGGPATAASLTNILRGIAVGADGSVYIADSLGARVRQVTPDGIIETIAGDGTYADTGDGGPARDAQVEPFDVALGPQGQVFIASNRRVRVIDVDGIIHTIAGNGTSGYSGDGGPAILATFRSIRGLAVGADALYISDNGNQTIRRVDTQGIITTYAGKFDAADSGGDGGPLLEAGIEGAVGLSVDGLDQLYIAESGARNIRRINAVMPNFDSGDIGIASPSGAEFFQFDPDGRHLRTYHSLTGAVLFEFGYGANGRLQTITDRDGKVTTINRDVNGHPTGIVSPFGQQTLLTTDANGFLASITNPAGEALAIKSTPGGLITKLTDPRGRISSYEYDDLGRLTSASDNTGFSQTLVRSGAGNDFNVTRTTGLGRSVAFEVQTLANDTQLNTNTATDGSQSAAEFQASAGAISATSATGTSSSISEGPDPRFGMQAPIVISAEINAPAGPTMLISSSSDAELDNPADPLSLVSLSGTATVDGRTLTSHYTAASGTRTITSPEGRSSTVTIDNLGRVVSRQRAGLAPVTATYNGLGQLETLTAGVGPDARMTSFTYGADGFRDSITDALGQITRFERDAAGRVTTTILQDDTEVITAYSAAGDLISLTPPGRSEHSFAFDLHGQLDSITPPFLDGSGTTDLEYNADRQLTSISRPGGEGVTFSYDNEGQVQTIEQIQGGTPSTSYVYTYLSGSRIETITGPGSQAVAYGYQGDVVVAETWSGIVAGEITWDYDDAYRLTEETVSGSAPITYGYDDDDLLTSAGAASISRNAANGLVDSSDLGVVHEDVVRNGFGEVVGRIVTVNAVPVYEVAYTRDALGRITQKVETTDGPAETFDYDYDPAGQLTEVRRNNQVVESYSYDDNGNRLSATVAGMLSSGSYDAQDRLVSYAGSAYSHSASGRLQSRTDPGDLTTVYDYDAVGNLLGVTLPDMTEVTFGVDGVERRVERKVDGAITHRWLFDGIKPLAELNGSGTVISRFVYAGGHVPLYLVREGSDYRLITDNVGSVRLVVNASDGTIAQRLDYDSFGNVINDTNPGFQPFGFAGGLYDPLTGLIRFGARDYDPKAGRWTAKDPTGFVGMDSNLYRYANNDPINKVDHTGLDFWDAALGAAHAWYDLSLGSFVEAMSLNPSFGGALAIYDGLDAIFGFDEPHIGDLLPPPNDLDDFQAGYIGLTCAAAVASIPLTAGAGAVARNAKAARTAERLRAARQVAEQELRQSGRQVYSHQQKYANDLKRAEETTRARQAANKAKGSEQLQNMGNSGWKTGGGGGGPLNGYSGGGG